jgi:hypothetical protein
VVKEIRLYFEGDNALKPGFHAFLREIIDKARAQRIQFHPIAANGTPAKDYETALKTHREAWNILLRDSEGPNTPDSGSRRDSEFWMVQAMETWFLADPDALDLSYGEGFKRGALKQNPKVEEIPKTDVLASLKQATAGTKKDPYHKTKHAPHILDRIDPQKVRKAAPNCERLFGTVLDKLK